MADKKKTSKSTKKAKTKPKKTDPIQETNLDADIIYNLKSEILFSVQDGHILDGQSKICNWLYNHLLEIVNLDYELFGSVSELTKGENIRNMVPALKGEFPFLCTVYSSPSKNVGRRLKDAFKRFLNGDAKHPKFRSWKKKWFSLFYDEPMKGYSFVDDKHLEISLGKDINNKQMSVVGELRETIRLSDNEKIKTFRLCKEKGKFYAVFTIQATASERKDVNSWIAIDQNQKNFFVAIDNNGQTFEFAKLFQDKYFDNIIDELKSKRDKCNKKHKKKTTLMSNVDYYIPNKRWLRFDKAIKKAYARKQEQTKQTMYAIAHFIAANYDRVIIGDYVPSKSEEGISEINKSVINQSHVGAFRQILKWVMTKSHKEYYKVSEMYTTQDCCVCGHREKKDVDVRAFTCPSCGTYMLRDVNSSVNIGGKLNLKPISPSLSKINRCGQFIFKQQRLVVI